MDTGNKTNIERQINQGAHSVCNEHIHAAPEKTQIKLLTGFVSVAEEQVIGRDEQIAVLTKTFEQNRTVALVNGMGGIGKTTVALLYLSRNQNTYAHIAWIDISDSVENAFVYNTELQNGLGISEKVNEFIIAKQPAAAFDFILQTMRALPGKKLLVLDNANNHSDLMQGLKKLEKMGWQILVTTRDTSANETDYVSVRIDKLDAVDARKVFSMYYRADFTKNYTDAERNCVDDICHDLDCHTLLIEMTAKSGSMNNCSLAALRDIIHDGYMHSPALYRRKVATGISGKKAELSQADEQAFVAEHLRRIFEHVNWLPENETDKPTIKDLLAYHAVLIPDYHSEKDLLEYFGINAEQPTNIYSQWTLISQNGWLEETRHAEGGMQYKMHPLLQEMILHEKIIGDVSCENVLPIVDYFGNYFNAYNKPGDHAIFKKEKLEFGTRLVEVLDGDVHKNFSILQNNLGLILCDLGDLNGARDMMQKALATDEKNFRPDHPSVARSQTNLGMILRDLGDLNGARDLVRMALATDEKNFGPDHPSVALVQWNLGYILEDYGELKDAHLLYEKAHNIYFKLYGEDYFRTKNVKDYLDDILAAIKKAEE